MFFLYSTSPNPSQPASQPAAPTPHINIRVVLRLKVDPLNRHGGFCIPTAPQSHTVAIVRFQLISRRYNLCVICKIVYLYLHTTNRCPFKEKNNVLECEWDQAPYTFGWW